MNKKILGIDPGTRVTGYGLIQDHGVKIIPLDYGCIRPPAAMSLNSRYGVIFDALMALIERWKPDIVVVETQYIHKNIQSAIKLGMEVVYEVAKATT